jgi:hypothetical protein
MHIKFVVDSLNGRDHSENLGADGRIILKLILRKEGGRVWTALIWLRNRYRAFVNAVMNILFP